MPPPDGSCVDSIRLNAVTFGYSRALVFERLSLDSDASIVLLKGPNGSGKTTLLKLVVGMLLPHEGGQIIRPAPVGIILQEDGLLPWLTVERNLQVAHVAVMDDGALGPLAPIIRPLRSRRAYSLSFGQRRIVELYRILATRFRLICLDEPFNYLDARTVRTVADVIGTLASAGTRFLIASHVAPDWLSWHHVTYELDGSLPVRRLTLVTQ